VASIALYFCEISTGFIKAKSTISKADFRAVKVYEDRYLVDSLSKVLPPLGLLLS
jgi:hypothetical protein